MSDEVSMEDMVYELCHEIISKKVEIGEDTAEAIEPLLTHSSNRVAMAALMCYVRQEVKEPNRCLQRALELINADKSISENRAQIATELFNLYVLRGWL